MSSFIVEKERGMLWLGHQQSPATEQAFADYTGKLEKAFSLTKETQTLQSGDPETFLGPNSYKPGGCYYVSHEVVNTPQVEYSIEGASFSELDEDRGRLLPSHVTSFVTTGSDTGWNVAGTFDITTMFKGDKPVYKNIDNGWWCWFDGTEWVMSSPDKNTNDKVMKNGSKLPNYGTYSNGNNATGIFDDTCVEITDFTGMEFSDGEPLPASANGIFCEAGMYNGYKKFAHEDGNWFIYRAGTSGWVLTDTPYTRAAPAKFIFNGTGDTVGAFVHDSSDPSKSNGFDGQSGTVTPAGMLSGSLLTEADTPTMLLIEDKLKVLVTEATITD